ncbi:unnamed protein product [Fusarium graminearum]|nr:unnamed protein product [Fusarium graminearum]
MSDSDLMKEWVVVHRERLAPGNQPDSAAAPKTPHKSDLRETKELRYEYALKIEESLRCSRCVREPDYRLSAIYASIILLVPISTLEDGGFLDYKQEGHSLKSALLDIETLVRHYLRKSHEDRSEPKEEPETANPSAQQPEVECYFVEKRPLKRTLSTKETSRKRPSYRDQSDGEDNGDAAGSTDEANGETQKPKVVARHGTETTKCCIRDKFQCIFSGTSPGQPAHILPFAWNKDQDNHLQTDECFFGCRAFFDLSVIDKVATAMKYSDASNKYWNMVCIDDQLWSWWPSAYFDLKCLGVKPKQSLESESLEEPEFEVEIQFNWLCSRREEPDDLVYLEDDVNDMREMAEMQIKHEDDGSPAPKALDTNIVSGHTVTISMPENDALKCKIVLDIHWNIVCIAAMSSGADHPELLPEPILWVYDKG